jgi:hypothetical protein
MLGIFIWDYKKDDELLNVLLRPEEKNEKTKAFDKLFLHINR